MARFESDQSVFNMAMAYLKRIDMLLYRSQEAALSQNLDTYWSYLRAIYREISVKLTNDEKKIINGDPKQRVDLKSLLDEEITPEECNFKNINFLLNKKEIRFRFKTRILFLLDGLDIKLRGFLQQKGMLLPGRSDPRFAILER